MNQLLTYDDMIKPEDESNGKMKEKDENWKEKRGKKA